MSALHQGDLWEQPERPDEHEAIRKKVRAQLADYLYGWVPAGRDHPWTSKYAAQSLVEAAPNCRIKVLLYIVSCGDRGATADEVECDLVMRQSTASPRVTELHQAGLTEDSGRVRDTRWGKPAIVWVATQAVKDHINELLLGAHGNR